MERDAAQITQSFGSKALATWLKQHLSRVPLTVYVRDLELRPLHYSDDDGAVIGRLARRTVLVRRCVLARDVTAGSGTRAPRPLAS